MNVEMNQEMLKQSSETNKTNSTHTKYTAYSYTANNDEDDNNEALYQNFLSLKESFSKVFEIINFRLEIASGLSLDRLDQRNAYATQDNGDDKQIDSLINGLSSMHIERNGESGNKPLVYFKELNSIFPDPHTSENDNNDEDSFKLDTSSDNVDVILHFLDLTNKNCGKFDIVALLTPHGRRLHPVIRNAIGVKIDSGKDYGMLDDDFKIWRSCMECMNLEKEDIDEIMFMVKWAMADEFTQIEFSALTKSFSTRDLENVIANCIWKMELKKYENKLTTHKNEDDNNHTQDILFNEARIYSKSKPTSKAPYTMISPDSIKESWDSIQGLETIKQSLIETIIWPITKSNSFDLLKIEPTRSIVIYGPPGSGKNLLIRVAAKESRYRLLSVSIGDIIRGEVGESEKAISEVFRVAKESSPCIIFFDEIQALFGNRDNSGQVGRNMTSQLLLEMDKCQKQPLRDRILVMAATNDIDAIDTALRSRFERVLHITKSYTR